MSATLDDAREALGHFAADDGEPSIAVHPGGHINDSYRVTRAAEGGTPGWLLQRLNPRVFPDGPAVMANVAHVTRHIADQLRREGVADWRRRTLVLVPTRDGADWYQAPDGACWRLVPFIAGTLARERPRHARDAEQAAAAFGQFLCRLANYDGPPLAITLPGFHDTVARFAALDDAVRADVAGRAASVRAELDAVLRHRPMADVLPPLLGGADVPTRVVHNDAKMANVLFDERTGEALCVVDPDTVMPGSALHDFGDLVRSMASPTAEDERDVRRVGVRVEMFAALARGFLSTAGAVLTPAERALLPFAGELLTLEQAVRFLADHLAGDRYYRITRPGQNLDRARAQIALLESLVAHERELARLVER